MPVGAEVTVNRQYSGNSDTTARQNSSFSELTMDSGVVLDLAPFNNSPLSSNSISATRLNAPPRPQRQRFKLQRLAAIEDEDVTPSTEESAPVSAPKTVKSKLKSTFKSRFCRPAFRIPKCDF